MSNPHWRAKNYSQAGFLDTTGKFMLLSSLIIRRLEHSMLLTLLAEGLILFLGLTSSSSGLKRKIQESLCILPRGYLSRQMEGHATFSATEGLLNLKTLLNI